MKEFFDTSVLIASFWRGHVQHESSLKLFAGANRRKSACALYRRQGEAESIYTWNLKHFRTINPKLADRIRTP